jgi:hypothetical protein
MSFIKSATCESGIVLMSLRMSYPDKSNQVLAKEYSEWLLVYIVEIWVMLNMSHIYE